MIHNERMSPVDTTWLRMDRAVNRMTIVGVMALAPPVDIERLEQTLAARMLSYPRFRQRVEMRAATAWWVEDPHFDISRHIRRVRLPGRGGKAELQRFVGELCAQPLDMEHPLWQFHIVEDYEGGAAVVPRFHHAVADGMALVAVLMALTDEEPDAPLRRLRPHHLVHADGYSHSVFAPVAQAVDRGLQFSGVAWRQALKLLTHPSQAATIARAGAGVVSELAWLLLMPKDTPTRYKGAPNGSKRVAWSEPLPLSEVKIVSHALACSVNDILLTSVAGALRLYLEEKGDDTEGVEIRALVPLNLRPSGSEEQLGNYFGIVAVELPVGVADPIERLHEVRRRMAELKKSYEAPVTFGLFAALGYAPKIVQDQLFDLLLSRATAVMTNVPGPQHALYLAGSKLDQVMFWVPQTGDIGMGVSILSFGGNVQFGLVTDSAFVPDPDAIISRFNAEFEQLLYYVLLGPWGEEPQKVQDGPAPSPARTPAQKPRRARAAKPKTVASAAARPTTRAPRKTPI